MRSKADPLEPFLDALADLLAASVLRDLTEGKIKAKPKKTRCAKQKRRAR